METADYCDYELSLALKVAGFDYPCYFYYTKKNAPDDCVWQTTSEEAPVNYNRRIYAGCSMPLLSQAQKWLREKGIAVSVQANEIQGELWYSADIITTKGINELVDGGFGYMEYESALAAGIETALELIIPDNNGKEG